MPKYSEETIVRMLLNADIDKHKERICTEWPVSVQSSATFVIDVTSLKHADDVKKDNFGKWIHLGSHKTQYHVNFDENGGIRLEKCYTGATGDGFLLSTKTSHVSPI